MSCCCTTCILCWFKNWSQPCATDKELINLPCFLPPFVPDSQSVNCEHTFWEVLCTYMWPCFVNRILTLNVNLGRRIIRSPVDLVLILIKNTHLRLISDKQGLSTSSHALTSCDGHDGQNIIWHPQYTFTYSFWYWFRMVPCYKNDMAVNIPKNMNKVRDLLFRYRLKP